MLSWNLYWLTPFNIASVSALDLEIMIQSSTYMIIKLVLLVNIQGSLDIDSDSIDCNPSVKPQIMLSQHPLAYIGSTVI